MPFSFHKSFICHLHRAFRSLFAKHQTLNVSKADSEGNPINVYSKAGGLGDELMTAMAIQAKSAVHPNSYLNFHTRFHTLFDGLQGANTVVPLQQQLLSTKAIGLTYEAKHHLSVPAQMADQLGVTADVFSLQLPERPLRLPTRWPDSSARIVLIQTAASRWTPNKQWPTEHWLQLINQLPVEWKVVEVGTESALDQPPDHPGWLSFVGTTNLDEYVSCFRSSDVFVGPVSSGMHIAHAFNLPSVIIVGGYEAANFPYPFAIQIGTSIECSPCWLRNPCPFSKVCLGQISVTQVTSKIMAQLRPID